jgi:hypothetical protein
MKTTAILRPANKCTGTSASLIGGQFNECSGTRAAIGGSALNWCKERLEQKKTEIAELKQTVTELQEVVRTMHQELNGGER